MNVATAGDANARTAFLVLLLPSQQRAHFLRLIKKPRALPRIRSLVGRPPFSFLLPEDEGLYFRIEPCTSCIAPLDYCVRFVPCFANYCFFSLAGILRAQAVAAGRVNTFKVRPAASDVGTGQFSDALGRGYRIIAKEFEDISALAWYEPFTQTLKNAAFLLKTHRAARSSISSSRHTHTCSHTPIHSPVLPRDPLSPARARFWHVLSTSASFRELD